jgi:GT2 family glycosyltransferase
MQEPLISVIVPTFNRPDKLRACLAALAKLDYPRDRFEVLVVDDGSTRPLDPVVAAFSGRLDVNLIRQENSGPAKARNRGAATARGELLAFTDDDCEPDAKWLAQLEQAHLAAPAHMIGGEIINAYADNVYSTASQELIAYLYSYYESLGQPRLFVTSNVAVPAQAFREIGGFDTRFGLPAGEDREFCDRWLHRGFGMTYAPDAIVHHYHALELRTFVRQHMNYGRGAFHVYTCRAQRGGKFRVEPLAFYLNMMRYPFGVHSGVEAVTLSALFALAQWANAAGFFREKLARRAG